MVQAVKSKSKSKASSENTEVACPCGRGVNYTACCGRLASSEMSKRSEPAQVLLLYKDAQQAIRDNRIIHALTAAREIIRQVPLHYGAIRMAMALPGPVRVFSAEELQDIIAAGRGAYPDDMDIQCDACDAYMSTGQGDKAEPILREILKQHPQHFRAHVGLGHLSQRRNQLDHAEFHFRQAYYQRQYAPGVLRELGSVLSAMGRKNEAEHNFRIALAQSPGDVSTLLAMCRMEESRGNLEQSWKLLELARVNSSDQRGIMITEAVLHRRQKNFKQSINALDRIDFEKLEPAGRVSYGMERSMTLDKMGLYEQAFMCASRANSLKENELGFKYDGNKHASEAEKLKKLFTATRFKAKGVKGVPVSENEERPIFICGFTRSGTSMLENILSAHSNISGGDELPFIYDLAGNAQSILGSNKPFPECVFEKPKKGEPSPFQVLRQRYLSRLRLTSILEPGVRKFTDKMPMNELHLGLIYALFPEAKIIHIVRHPLDSILSTFFTDASHGGYCSYNLESASKHYRLLIEMTEHYRKGLGLNIHRVRYEDIVNNIEKEAKKIMKFLDEDLEQQCLDFHLNPRFSRTASYAQVTEKLYDSSVYRYKNYKKHLAPIIPELESTIKLLGYKI